MIRRTPAGASWTPARPTKRARPGPDIRARIACERACAALAEAFGSLDGVLLRARIAALTDTLCSRGYCLHDDVSPNLPDGPAAYWGIGGKPLSSAEELLALRERATAEEQERTVDEARDYLDAHRRRFARHYLHAADEVSRRRPGDACELARLVAARVRLLAQLHDLTRAYARCNSSSSSTPSATRGG